MIRILHVEDSADDVELFQLALDARVPDWRDVIAIEVVDSVEAARMAITKCRPHLVLLDLNLATPIMGLDLLTWMYASEKLRRIPVIVLTGSTGPISVSAAYRQGAALFVTKTGDFAALTKLAGAAYDLWTSAQPAPDSE